MKKAKMMLAGIAVLAVVGGALAFKAKSAFSDAYCTIATNVWNGTCPNSINQAVFTTDPAGAAGLFYYTTTAIPADCSLTTPD